MATDIPISTHSDTEVVPKRAKPTSRATLIWRRLRATPRFWVGGILLAFFVLFALFGNTINIYSPTDQDVFALNEGPSAQHWFGTNTIGQDIYAQTVVGLQKSLLIGIIAGPAASILAAIIGSAAGYFGGRVEAVIVWFINLLLVLPAFFILVLMAPLLRQLSWMAIVVFLVLFGWMIMAQVVRNQTKAIKDRDFVRAARYMGVSTPKILSRHIIPNVASILIVDATLGVVSAIIAETSLSYFNLGIQKPALLTYLWVG
ncbi:ABC transporter permease [Brevibacterium linens]|uniref:Oligopeptide transport system permease protein OppC n=1 Tax=Brevibacterium linens TaxID=1703 RepID=A0A2H1JGQ7_BRELN|nr:ABC transporter permease [Brevibacterium linens]SMX86574.1 peptide/nickel transport system permease protein [Brevibacterium linens]